jgi:hypothetical protein
MLLDEGLQRHGRAAADRLEQVVGAGEDAGLVVGRHLAPSRTLGRFAPPAQQTKGLQPVSYLGLFRAGYFTKAVRDSR